MSALNLDFLNRLATIDVKHVDSAPSTTANSQSAFGDYLQRAQTQSSDALPQTTARSSRQANDRTATTPAAPQKTAQGDANHVTDQPSSRAADRGPRKNTNDSSTRRQSTTATNSSQQDSAPQASANNDPKATSQDPRGTGGGQNGSGSSNQDSDQTSKTSKDDAHKVANGDAAAAIVEISMAAAQAASVMPAAASSPVSGGVTPATTIGNPANVALPAVAAHASAASTAAATSATAQAATADAANAVANEVPATTSAGAAADPVKPTATAAKSDGKPTAQGPAAGSDLMAAVAAVTPASPVAGAAASAPSDTAPSQPVAAGGVRAATAAKAVDTAAVAVDSTTDQAAQAPDAQAAREQRLKSAVDGLSQTDSSNDANAAKSQPTEAPAGSTAAAQPNTPHNATGGASASTASETGLSQSDRVRFVQRVEQAVQDLSSQGGSVRLRLSPPDLGSLNINIKVVKGELTARVEAETTAARNVLLDNLPALRERLAQHDIKVQRFDVDLMDRSGGGAANQSSQYQNPSQQYTAATQARTPFRTGSELPAAAQAGPSRPINDGGRLNVIV